MGQVHKCWKMIMLTNESKFCKNSSNRFWSTFMSLPVEWPKYIWKMYIAKWFYACNTSIFLQTQWYVTCLSHLPCEMNAHYFGNYQHARNLLNPGSQTIFFSTSLAETFKLQEFTANVPIKGISQSTSAQLIKIERP